MMLYLDGYHVCADPFVYTFCDLTIPAGAPFGGALRLGRGVIGTPINGRDAQFYGLIDDVAIFKGALSENQIKAIYGTPNLTGNEPDLIAGLTFDDLASSGGPLPLQLKHAVTFKSVTSNKVSHVPAYKVVVSEMRNDTFDAQMLPPPIQQTTLQLPFARNQAWKVIQGFDDPSGTHNDYAAFSYDFMRIDQPANGQIFTAAAGGTVLEVLQADGCRPSPSDKTLPNNIVVVMATKEIAAYLHLKSRSSIVVVGNAVTTGANLAQVGDSGAPCLNYHLHFAVSDLPQSQPGQLVTFPVAFSNYQASDDEGQTWYNVAVGIPQKGQWIK
jgi:hypothetical protein